VAKRVRAPARGGAAEGSRGAAGARGTRR
jgi:hypothetical protein